MYIPSKYAERANVLARNSFEIRMTAMGAKQLSMSNADIFSKALLRKKRYHELLAHRDEVL
ncbi:MAG: hypothetical protein LBS01_07290 [Prevotellaceae bacterium]|jgi:hypothetical protein|nr:hypothetical protein [Prevotellaceae bacterium]